MLRQFIVKNSKSIRDEITFDMQAAAISEHDNKIIKDIDGELFLPISVIYGPNGGGKSNVLEALHTLACSALFRRDTESTELKGNFGKLKISEDLSATLPLISYLGIISH